ncbi:MAG TPA: shikimate kinase [Rhodoglobus sp.]|nr:shikimate kinase [Rhodoglobus sp.]
MTDDGAVVVLIGAPGAGKTRTAKRVARRLELSVIDTDKTIVAEHGPIAGIFAEHGEPHFRALERAAVQRALAERAVVSLGGGAVLDPGTQADLAGRRVVQLTMTPEAAALRVTDPKRPLSSDPEAWARLVAARQPIYDRLAGLTIDTSSQPLDRVAQQIVEWLESTA